MCRSTSVLSTSLNLSSLFIRFWCLSHCWCGHHSWLPLSQVRCICGCAPALYGYAASQGDIGCVGSSVTQTTRRCAWWVCPNFTLIPPRTAGGAPEMKGWWGWWWSFMYRMMVEVFRSTLQVLHWHELLWRHAWQVAWRFLSLHHVVSGHCVLPPLYLVPYQRQRQG